MHPSPFLTMDISFLETGSTDPHSILGLHILGQNPHSKVIRIWRPGAKEVFITIRGVPQTLACVNPAGLFELEVSADIQPGDYQIWHNSSLSARDPYSFTPSLGETDRYLFNKGVHYRLYDVLGAKLATHEGVRGVRFAVWAPSASRVALVADFNHWDGRVNPMRPWGNSGIWELFVPGLREGEKYKFEIRDQQGNIQIKSDPFAFQSEMRPSTASIVADVNKFLWEDYAWLEKRYHEKNTPKPMNIYEVHLGSWKTHNGHFKNYRELAVELADYCTEMGFTHIELMPILEHPLDESWGYQVSGYYSVTSRYGTPEDFQWFVNHLHLHNIGVLLDWVPGHFPMDDFGLSRFDGTALFEHEDPKQGYHPHWHTHIFNFGRHEVSNFLIANALYWFDVMHIDGLRVDAVASMLYLDYGREEGGWVPNAYGGKENLEAIEFIKHLNSAVHKSFPGILMIAEESTSFTGVTHPVDHGGLGFDYKWNMGWMNDTLSYFNTDMIFRHYHHNNLTFGQLYSYSEKFILVFSHDEVVHGKGSLISKMPGDIWQRFANLRLLYSYMICQPGKKLLFMGGEIAQWNEWWCKREIEWDLLKFPYHSGIQRMVKEINHIYHNESALWERDHDYTGFEWVDFSDTQNSVISYLRKSANSTLLCVHCFTPNMNPHYSINLHNVEHIEQIFNSDASSYGGADNHNTHPKIYSDKIEIVLAPLATVIFRIHWKK
ncbi:MAG: 1,4-alpha-glucan branching protein GlgB [Parachlamydiales bacterium]|jgi:1,4-alpha-glucan branching enzyme